MCQKFPEILHDFTTSPKNRKVPFFKEFELQIKFSSQSKSSYDLAKVIARKRQNPNRIAVIAFISLWLN